MDSRYVDGSLLKTVQEKRARQLAGGASCLLVPWHAGNVRAWWTDASSTGHARSHASSSAWPCSTGRAPRTNQRIRYFALTSVCHHPIQSNFARTPQAHVGPVLNMPDNKIYEIMNTYRRDIYLTLSYRIWIRCGYLHVQIRIWIIRLLFIYIAPW
jgi:hypothetical protein